jgi:hypothetical protein
MQSFFDYFLKLLDVIAPGDFVVLILPLLVFHKEFPLTTATIHLKGSLIYWQ